MRPKTFDAVEMKRHLQEEAEKRLQSLSEKQQLELLHKKFGHLVKRKKDRHGALQRLVLETAN